MDSHALPHLLELAYADEDAYLTTLAELVEYETPTADKARADRFADRLEQRLAADGWQVERFPREAVGDIVLGRKGERPLDGDAESGGVTAAGTLLLCHYDTVWPVGTLTEMPIRRDGDRFFGPGTCDMKAGIATALHATRLAERDDTPLPGPVTLLITSDEETGSRDSRELIEAEAQRHERVLVLEPSRDDGAIKIGRKGGGRFTVTFEGVGAHAGNNPEDGASALRELAHFLFFVEDLADDDRSTTVNLTVAHGGSVSNVIPERAEAQVDVRVLNAAEGPRLEQAVHGYSPRNPRVSVTVEGGINRPPLEPTDANRELFYRAQEILVAMGLEPEGAVVGGGSDGNFTSALGIPTLDGLGCSGVGPHARHEHIQVRGTLERVALVAALLSGEPVEE